jgi:hypothetical protein
MQIAEAANTWKCLSFVGKIPYDNCESVITQLYRFYSQNGTLLYVGISLSAIGRYSHHRKSASWWLEISRIEVINYPSRKLAEDAEIMAITLERPLYNKEHSPYKSKSDRAKAREQAHLIGRGLRWPAENQQLEYEIVALVSARSLEKQMLIDEITEYGVLGDPPEEWVEHSRSLGFKVDSWEQLDSQEPEELLELFYALEDAADEWLKGNEDADWR